MGKPVASIITINLNDAFGLERTIKSVLDQSYPNYELIVIDGHSSDNSSEIINKYTEKIAYWVSEPDKGIYHAMNKGIATANGKYCFFLNSGDYFTNDLVLEEVFSENRNEDIVFGNLQIFLKGKLVGIHKGKAKLSFLDVYMRAIRHQAAFIKTTTFAKYGMFDETLKISADWDYFLKTVGLGSASYCYVNLDIACFDNNGLSNNNPSIVEKERTLILSKNLPLLMQKDYERFSSLIKYRLLSKYRFSNFIIRVLYKIMSFWCMLFEKHKPIN